MVCFCTATGIEPSENESTALVDSFKNWPPFVDTLDALAELNKKFGLAIISNVDDDLFEHTRQTLQTEFNHIITAQQARAYKPDLSVFTFALNRFGLPKDQILHCAQSLFHDIAPARIFDIRTVWVNRRKGQTGFGATPPSDARPDYEVPDLRSLVELLASS